MADSNRAETDPTIEQSLVLETAVERANQTLDRQLRQLETLNAKAVEILKTDAVFVGLVLTGFTFAAENVENITIQALFLNEFVVVGFVSILSSIVLAVIAYGPKRQKIGVGRDCLREATRLVSPDNDGKAESDYEIIRREVLDDAPKTEIDIAFYRYLADEYKDMLSANHRVMLERSLFTTLAALLVVFSLVSFTVGVFDVFVVNVPLSGVAMLVIGLLVVVWFMDLVLIARKYLN